MTPSFVAGIPYECSDRPWFGPKTRAAEHLRAHRRSVSLPQEAIREMLLILGPAKHSIQHIRFIDFRNSSQSGFRYTIALVEMASNAEARDAMFELAGEIVARTGWYPLVQGERLSSLAAERRFWAQDVRGVRRRLPLQLGGELRSLEAATGEGGGCAIRVRMDDGNILLDSGLPGDMVPSDKDRIVLISHAHLDHSGGATGDPPWQLPVVLSPATARVLSATSRVSGDWLREHAWLLGCERDIRVGGVTVHSFRVPHSPGSVAYVIEGTNGSVVYSSDTVLSSARHDFVPALSDILLRHNPANCTLLLDATMAGRSYGATSSNAALSVLKRLPDYDDIVFRARDAEQLLYAYLDLFYSVKSQPRWRSRVEFVASSSLRCIFEILHAAYIGRRLDQLDPLLVAQYGGSMSAWAETCWLYWTGPECRLGSNSTRKRLWFLTEDDHGTIPGRARTGIVLIGRSTRDAPVELLGEHLVIDSSGWTAHSSEAALREAIARLPRCRRVVLFHNYPRRLNRFIRKSGIDAIALEQRGLAL